MKQLLFLLLFPAFAMAQYPGNAGQKITLGEQTSADGLVYRGLASDTTRKPSVDTMAYILLDTNTNIIWQYKKATSNAWTRVGGSISSGLTGVLPVANGGTATSTAFTQGSVVFAGASGTYTQDNSNLFWNNTTKRLGIGTINPVAKLDVVGSGNYDGQIIVRSTGTNTPVFVMGVDAIANPDGYVGSQNNIPFGIRTNDVNRIWLTAAGNVGIGTTSPTARLHIAAGTSTANTAPLKFTSGTNLTTAEAGAMEFNGTNLFFSPSTTRHTVNHGLTGSATLDFPSTTTLLSADLTITVTGASDGDVVSLGVPNAAVNANTCYTAWVSAANTVTVRFNNYSSGTVDPASALFKVFVTK